jgi:diguanylate cyclase (GGDEF)-like protein
MTRDHEIILVADDDPDISTHLEMTLRNEGYEVHIASDGDEVVDLARRITPDLVLLDVEMPYVSGYDACRTLRADVATATTPIIMVTGNSATTQVVEGLEAGADDYLAKPYQTTELLARVRSVLRRSSQLRASSPLTGLPGNDRIHAELDRCCRAAVPFALVYADLDHFKAFNDYYGFLRGDHVIRFTARVLVEVLAEVSGEPRFAGHVGGDDFIALCPPEALESFCNAVARRFDAGIEACYDAADVERGWLEVPDRRGEVRRFPLMTISLGAASTSVRALDNAGHAATVASEMKSVAKKQPGSSYSIDRRHA